MAFNYYRSEHTEREREPLDHRITDDMVAQQPTPFWDCRAENIGTWDTGHGWTRNMQRRGINQQEEAKSDAFERVPTGQKEDNAEDQHEVGSSQRETTLEFDFTSE